jgi:hypothetical protein
MMVIHADDFIWSGSQAFQKKVIDQISKKFEIGKEAHGDFKFIGLDVVHKENSVLSQSSYIDQVNPIEITKAREFQKHFPVSDSERKKLRELVGKLNWVTTQSRPDLGFETLDHSMCMKDANVCDLITANKAVS